MSTHKRIDLVCIIATVLALALTVLFMNGAALGLTPVNNDAQTDGPFTANDLNGSWDTSSATRILLAGDGGKVTGGGAYVEGGDVHIIQEGQYVLSGELFGGSVIIEANQSDKIWLLLDGVTLHRDDSAAIDIEQAGKVFLTLAEGTENTVTTGTQYSDEAAEAGIDGAIYSRDDLTVNGAGSLTVSTQYKHAIVCNDDLVITGGTLDITAAQDGIHANDSVSIAQADITITAGDDGITVGDDGETACFYMESGSLTIPACYEGIEAVDITIAGGTVDITPTDDGINANGQGQNSILRVTGGDIRIVNSTGRDADGLDSNGNIEITGGNIFISDNTSSCALDCGTESGGSCTISGGTVIAAGGSSMAEGFDASSPQAFVMQNVSGQEGAQIVLTDSHGAVLVDETIPCAFSNLVLSTSDLTLGDAVTLTVGDTATQLTVDNSTTGGGFGGGKMGGSGGMGRPDFGQMPADGQMPTSPEGMERPDDMERPEGMMGGRSQGAQRPDGDWPEGMTGGRGNRGDWMEKGQSPSDQTAQKTAEEGFQIDETTVALVAASAVILLAGILIAFKFKR